MGDSAAPLLTASRVGLAGIATAMPLYVVRFHAGPVPTTLLEVLILATCAAYVAALVLRQAPTPGRTGFEIPIALFLVAGVIGIAVAPDHRAALGIFRAYLLEPVAVFYVAVAVLRLDRSLTAVLAVAGVGALVFAVLEVVAVVTPLTSGTLDISHAAAALQINPNSVALYLEPLIAMAAGFVLFAPARTRALSGVILLALLVAAVATFSRGALAAIAVLGIIVLVTVGSWAMRAVVAAGAAVASAVAWQITALRLRITYTFTEQGNGPLFNRPHIWGDTLRMLRDHPLFGAGISGYQTVMAPYRGSGPYNVPEPYAHDIFLSTWSELGLLGLAAFVWILGRLLIRPWRALGRAAGVQVPLLWGTGAAFAMLTAHGLVDTPYWKNDLSVEFWMLAAIQVVSLRAVAR